jgi:hypothetical protein
VEEQPRQFDKRPEGIARKAVEGDEFERPKQSGDVRKPSYDRLGNRIFLGNNEQIPRQNRRRRVAAETLMQVGTKFVNMRGEKVHFRSRPNPKAGFERKTFQRRFA